MNTYETIIVIECVAVIVFLFIIIAVSASIKKRKKQKQQERMMSHGLVYGQDGLYVPVTEEEMRLMQEQAKAYAEMQYNGNNYYGKKNRKARR